MNRINTTQGAGVEHILSVNEGPGAVQLPKGTIVFPSDITAAATTAGVGHASGWDTELSQYTRPVIKDKRLLLPGVFMHRLMDAKQELAEAVRQTDSPQLQAAIAVMKEDSELQQLFMSYKNALMQG